MTPALIALALLAALIAYRLWKLPASLKQRQVATSVNTLLSQPAPAPKAPPHMVFNGAIEHNEFGFITTPLKECDDPACPCRTFKL